MKKIPHPLPLPTPKEMANTDADAKKRVRNQLLRVKRRAEEIARLTAENADAGVCGVGGDLCDLGDIGDYGDLDDNHDDNIRYVRILVVVADVLSCATTGALVLARSFAIFGFLSVRSQQHAGLQ